MLHPTTISGLTLFDGNAIEEGGAIRSTESLALTDVVVESCVSGERGGGVSVDTPGKASFTRVQMIDNLGAGRGGGAFIEATGSVSVLKSLFALNRGDTAGGGLSARSMARALPSSWTAPPSSQTRTRAMAGA